MIRYVVTVYSDMSSTGSTAALDFECTAVEVWAVEEHACRASPLCRKHVKIREDR